MKVVKSVIAAATLALFLPAAGMAAGGPEPVAPSASAFRLGELSLTCLSDANYVVPNDGKIFGADAGPAAVAEVLKAAQAPTDKITLPVDALLVRDGSRVVLIDTGLGEKVGGTLVNSLKLAGVAPAQVTDVLITHPHPDHIGGLVSAEGKSVFTNAKIRFSSADWAWLQGQTPWAGLVKAIASQVEAFEPGAKVAPSITAVAIKGHTPGHVGYLIVSGKERLLDIGDMAHSSIISLAKPEWIMGFDSDAHTAKASRRETLTQLAKERQTIFAPHFPYPGIGTVAVSGEGFVWKPASLPKVD